jgi:hypothetical protein
MFTERTVRKERGVDIAKKERGGWRLVFLVVRDSFVRFISCLEGLHDGRKASKHLPE